jgi:hypothetical protein
MQFESHLGHSVSAGQMLFAFLLLTKPPKVLSAAYRFLCGQHSNAPKGTDQRPIWSCGGTRRAASSRV